MEIANIHEAKSQLSKLVEHAMNGEEVIIAKAGRKASPIPSVQVCPQWIKGNSPLPKSRPFR